MKKGDRYIYCDSTGVIFELEFYDINGYGNYTFYRCEGSEVITGVFGRWVWTPCQLHLLYQKEVWNSPLMKALR